MADAPDTPDSPGAPDNSDSTDVITQRHGVTLLLCAADGTKLGSGHDAVELIGAALQHRVDVVVVPAARSTTGSSRWAPGVAGAIVQKFVNYRLQLAIVGDITLHLNGSSALHDFVRESNRGRQLWFVTDTAQLDTRLENTRNRDATRWESGLPGSIAKAHSIFPAVTQGIHPGAVRYVRFGFDCRRTATWQPDADRHWSYTQDGQSSRSDRDHPANVGPCRAFASSGAPVLAVATCHVTAWRHFP
jgi:hypothetical protein